MKNALIALLALSAQFAAADMFESTAYDCDALQAFQQSLNYAGIIQVSQNGPPWITYYADQNASYVKCEAGALPVPAGVIAHDTPFCSLGYACPEDVD